MSRPLVVPVRHLLAHLKTYSTMSSNIGPFWFIQNQDQSRQIHRISQTPTKYTYVSVRMFLLHPWHSASTHTCLPPVVSQVCSVRKKWELLGSPLQQQIHLLSRKGSRQVAPPTRMHENVVEDGGKGGVINCETTTHMQDTCSHILSTSKLLFLLGLCNFCHSPYRPHSSYFCLGVESERRIPESAAEGPVWVTLTL